MFTSEQREQLQAPLDGSLVKTRQQAGRSLSYIEGWAAIDKANQIFGHGEWSYTVTRLELIGQREVTSKEGRKGHEVAYYAIVRLSIGPDTRYEDTGYGSGTDYNSPFSAHESATKEAVTDALKRCFKNLGYTFGLALYDKTQEHVDRGEPAAKESTTRATTVPRESSATLVDPSVAAYNRDVLEHKRKAFWAVVSKAGIDSDIAKDTLKERWSLESFNDATPDQLQGAIDAIEAKYGKEQA